MINPVAWQPGFATRLDVLIASRCSFESSAMPYAHPLAVRCAVDASMMRAPEPSASAICLNRCRIRQAQEYDIRRMNQLSSLFHVLALCLIDQKQLDVPSFRQTIVNLQSGCSFFSRLYKSSVSPLFVPRFPVLLLNLVFAYKFLNHRNLAGYFFRSRSADYLTSTYTGLQINRFIYIIFKDIGMCLVLFQCQIG